MATKMKNGSVSQKRKARELERRRSNREAILHAAEAVIGRKGLSTTSMDDVAAEAGFSKATLYKYVKGKSELVFDLLIHFLEDLDDQLAQVLARPVEPEAKLLLFLREIFRYQTSKENISRAFMSDPSHIRILQAMAEDKNHPAGPAERAFLRRFISVRQGLNDRIKDFVRDSIATGAFRPVPLEAAIHFLNVVILGYQHEHFFRESEPNLEKDVLSIHGFILHGLKTDKKANA